MLLLFFSLLLDGHASSEGYQPKGDDLLIESSPGQLLGEKEAQRYSNILAPDKLISWEIYHPGNDFRDLPGVLVYISPMDTGQIDSRWRSVMDQQNMIYISANESGNQTPTARRMVLATLAIKALGQKFAFDPEKIRVSGFSGGGRVASRVATQYPEAFTGALYICGVDPWKSKQTPRVDRLIQNRFVFLTGSRDFNRMETRKVHQRYLKAGAVHSKLMVVSGMSHERPDAEVLSEALTFLNQQDSSAGTTDPQE